MPRFRRNGMGTYGKRNNRAAPLIGWMVNEVFKYHIVGYSYLLGNKTKAINRLCRETCRGTVDLSLLGSKLNWICDAVQMLR